jgi:hypothetical protein
MTQQAPMMNQLVERVELHISCKGLKNMDILSLSDPLVQLSVGLPQPNRSIQWKPIGKTEMIKVCVWCITNTM